MPSFGNNHIGVFFARLYKGIVHWLHCGEVLFFHAVQISSSLSNVALDTTKNPNIIVGFSSDLRTQIRTITNGLAGVSGLAVTGDGHIFACNIFGSKGFIVEYGAGPNPIQMRQGPDTVYPSGVALLAAH